MDGRNEMSGATGEPRRPAVAPVNLPARISPDGGQDSPYEATVNGSLSARRPQSARVKPQRPNSARASSAQFRRTYSVPPPQGAIAAHGHSGYYHGPPGTPRGPGHYDDYGPGVGIPPPSPWTAGVQVPVFSPWGYDLAWGAQSGGSAYGMAMAGGGMPRRCDKPTRIVFVGEVPKGVSDERLQEAAAKHGAIRGLDATQREASGGVFVMYYDLRDAEEALKGLPAAIRTMDAAQGEQLRVMACFMLPPVGVAGMENQAIIALPSCEMSRSELRSMFGKFGEIRDVRRGGGHGQGPDWRVVEFFDTRDAERAMADIRSRKGPKAEYAPFSGLENACHPVSPPPYGMYQQGYPVSGPVAPKREEAGMPGGFEAPGHAAPPAVWPVASMGTPTGGYGVWPFTVAPAAHPAGYGREGLQPASRSMGEAGGAGDGVGESGYAMPQNCRADYYCGPQYMGYPTGMPAMLPFGPGGQPLMIPTGGMYDAGLMTSLRPEMPTSPVHTSSATETHAWRPHRTGRGASERTYDPAQFEFSLDEARTKSTTARTTLMIRNIPNKYSQKMLLDVLDRKYSGRYDFFYLPIDFKNRCNLGYAFVNFRNSSTTAEFYKEFHSKSWEEFNSKKVCEITYARVQGRNALIEHFRNSRFPCNEPDYLPLVFEAVDEANHGKKASRPVTKATPVHHWTTMHYPNNAAVAAH